MSQHDFNIANQSFPATRTDINDAILAIVSNSSGDTEPSTTYANQWWYETDTNILKIRNEANNGWVDVITLDASMTASASELNQLDAITRGSILYGNASGETARLAKGGAGTVLTSDGTDISWAASAAGGLTYASVSGPASNQTIADGFGPANGTNFNEIAYNTISTFGNIAAQSSVITTTDPKIIWVRVSIGTGITANSLSGTGYIYKGLHFYTGVPSGTNTQTKVQNEGMELKFGSSNLTSWNNSARNSSAGVGKNTAGSDGYSFPVLMQPNEVFWVLWGIYDSYNKQGNATLSANAATLETWS